MIPLSERQTENKNFSLSSLNVPQNSFRLVSLQCDDGQLELTKRVELLKMFVWHADPRTIQSNLKKNKRDFSIVFGIFTFFVEHEKLPRISKKKKKNASKFFH